MATFRKRGTTRPFSWEAQVRVRGWPAQTKTFPTKADAEQWASEREAEMRRGTFVDTSSLRATTVHDLLARYLRDVTPGKKGWEPEAYRIHGAIQIIRYANRLEIRNPGHSIKAEEQLGEPGSETRNPRLAAVLHEVNIAETKGSGIRAMRELMLAHDLIPPTFESSRRPDQFVATFLFHHFLGPEDLAWLRGLTAESLSDEEARALVFVRELGAIDNAAYRSINRTDTLNASAHLRRLRDLALLEMKGSGNRTYYVPAAHFVASVASSGTETHQVGAKTHQVSRDTHQVPPDTHQAARPLPDELRARIPRKGSRPRRDVLRQLIVDLCRWEPLSSRALAEILGRGDRKHLVRDFLSPMVAEGLLAYTIPAMENHPDQRYAAAAEDV